jgi:hypothetical protein
MDAHAAALVKSYSTLEYMNRSLNVGAPRGKRGRRERERQ